MKCRLETGPELQRKAGSDMADRIRILVVEDHHVVRQGLVALLSAVAIF